LDSPRIKNMTKRDQIPHNSKRILGQRSKEVRERGSESNREIWGIVGEKKIGEEFEEVSGRK